MPKSDDGSAQDRAKIKRLNLKIRHLTEELEQAAELRSEYEKQFLLTINQLRSALGVKESGDSPKKTASPGGQQGAGADGAPDPNAKMDDEDIRHDIDNQSAKAPAWMKKVYKQIAMKTHPDKVSHANLSPYELAECLRLFNIAKQAVQDLNGADLIYVADVLGIDPEIPADMRISMLASRGEKLKQELQQIYQNPSWVWGESQGKNNVRKKILAGFCKLRGLKLPDEKFLDTFLEGLEK